MPSTRGLGSRSALKMVSDLLQPELRQHLQGAAKKITEGRSISYAMETNRLTTPVSLRMLQVGERTGEMGEMMERIAAFHDEEMARWVEWFTRLFEPLLMAVIGIAPSARKAFAEWRFKPAVEKARRAVHSPWWSPAMNEMTNQTIAAIPIATRVWVELIIYESFPRSNRLNT